MLMKFLKTHIKNSNESNKFHPHAETKMSAVMHLKRKPGYWKKRL